MSMISTKKELDFYLKSDMMMNRGYFKRSFVRWLYELWIPDEVMQYLRAMRKYSYYSNRINKLHNFRKIFYVPFQLYNKRNYIKFGNKLGFSIGPNCLGYGAVLHHPGTIVIGPSNRIGNYALINTSTCIVEKGSEIGNGFFMGSGAVITKQVCLGDNVWVGANTIINNSLPVGNALFVGMPGEKKRDVSGGWYEYLYQERWKNRHDRVEMLREKII